MSWGRLKRFGLDISPCYEDSYNQKVLFAGLEKRGFLGPDYLYRGTGEDEVKRWLNNQAVGEAQSCIGIGLEHVEIDVDEGDDLTGKVYCYTHAELLDSSPDDADPAKKGPVFWAYKNDGCRPRIVILRKQTMRQTDIFQWSPILEPRQCLVAAVALKID